MTHGLVFNPHLLITLSQQIYFNLEEELVYLQQSRGVLDRLQVSFSGHVSSVRRSLQENLSTYLLAFDVTIQNETNVRHVIAKLDSREQRERIV